MYNIVNTSNNDITITNVDLKNKIRELNELEKKEVFNIILNYKEKYTVNNNGIFINLSNVSNEAKRDLINFISFCKSNNKELCENEEYRNQFKNKIDNQNN